MLSKGIGVLKKKRKNKTHAQVISNSEQPTLETRALTLSINQGVKKKNKKKVEDNKKIMMTFNF